MVKSSAVKDFTARVAEHSRVLTNGVLTPIEGSILQALTYADVFDYPLTVSEIHRFLTIPAIQEEICAALELPTLLTHRYVEKHETFYTLIGRGEVVSLR